MLKSILAWRYLLSVYHICRMKDAVLKLPLYCFHPSLRVNNSWIGLGANTTGRLSNKAERIIVSTTCRGSIGWETVTAFLSELIEIQGDSSGSICVTNSNDSCLEQVDDLHKLFSTPGFFSIGLCLDISEFQKAIVNPADAIINFSDRIQAVRIDHQSTFENTVHDSIQLDSVLKVCVAYSADGTVCRAGNCGFLAGRVDPNNAGKT